MLGLVVVLVVVLLSLLITRVATVMLSITGMSRESARFQARSALTGVGFTTRESEVVNHPLRRRVVLILMLVGSAGVVTALGSLVISFGGASSGERVTRGLILTGGLLVLVLLSRSQLVDRALTRMTVRFMRSSGLDVRDYAGLLQISGGYTVGELNVDRDDWVARRTLGELRLRDEGVVVLGVHRSADGYVAVPDSHTRLQPGDTVMVYGHRNQLDELDYRRAGPEGDDAHERARAGREAGDRVAS